MSWERFLNLISVDSDDDEIEERDGDDISLLENGMSNIDISTQSQQPYHKNMRNRNQQQQQQMQQQNDHPKINKRKSFIKKNWWHSILDVTSSDEENNNDSDNVEGDFEMESVVIHSTDKNGTVRQSTMSLQNISSNSQETIANHSSIDNDVEEDEDDGNIFFDFDFENSDEADDDNNNSKSVQRPLNREVSFSGKEQYYNADKEYKKEFVLSEKNFIEMGIKDTRPYYERGNETLFEVLEVYIAFANTLVKAKEPKKQMHFQARNDMEFWQWINEIVSSFSKYIHCELIFMIYCKKDKKIRRIVSSIHRSKNLRLVQKKYRNVENGKWIFYHYKCSDEDKKKIFKFEYEKNKTEFNKWGFYLNFLLPDFLKIDNRGKKVFCSEEICHNLRETQSSLFGDLHPYKTDPYNLAQLLLSKTNQIEECDEPTPRKVRQMHS